MPERPSVNRRAGDYPLPFRDDLDMECGGKQLPPLRAKPTESLAPDQRQAAFMPKDGDLRPGEVAPFVFSRSWAPPHSWGRAVRCSAGPMTMWNGTLAFIDEATGLPCEVLHLPKIGIHVRRSLVPVHGHD